MKRYKGYTARVDYDPEEEMLVGRVAHIRDVVTFYARDLETLEREFHTSVDEYISFCREQGGEPERPFSGRVLLRLDPAVHKAASAAAREEGTSVNAWLSRAIEDQLASRQ
jgi:predicted HicB family RNase H-like nuclease